MFSSVLTRDTFLVEKPLPLLTEYEVLMYDICLSGTVLFSTVLCGIQTQFFFFLFGECTLLYLLFSRIENMK